MKRFAAILLSLLIVLFSLPLGASARLSSGTVIDTDGSDGYSGDYVVVYNPSTDTSSSMTTGNMSGLIETEVGGGTEKAAETPDLYRIDADPYFAELAKEQGITKPAGTSDAVKTSYEVGDTHTFFILNYSPDGMMMEFKVLAKGEHCYVWTPTSTAANVYPLDAINPDYAQMAADMFDSKYDLMQSSFGEHSNGSSGDGRLSLLYYNIDDGWELGQGYIGGYFYALDLYLDGMPVLNVDTYPGVHYVNSQGENMDDISRSYNVIVHEYQHLICFSQCGAADTWINESMSAAAEEICFPGSSIYSRIQSWTNHFYSGEDDLLDPPSEVEYIPGYELYSGYSLYDWSNDLPMDDLLVLYAQVSLFAQYLYSRFGNTVFHSIMDHMVSDDGLMANSFQSICEAATGVDPSTLGENFRVAVTANTVPTEYGGLYSFSLQPGYDPSEYNGVENPYDLLCPVVFTGTSCSIKGGGAICIKPVGGVYYPPLDAASGLVYIGVTRGSAPQIHTPGDLDSNGSVDITDALTVLRAALGLAELTPSQTPLADLNGDGAVTIDDALIVLRMALGLMNG